MLLSGNAFKNMTDFIKNFANLTVLSPTAAHGLSQYSGAFNDQPGAFTTVNATLNVTDPAAIDLDAFLTSISPLDAVGGTTDTAGAIDYVRTVMFTPQNKRPGSHRIVILATDGRPTDQNGVETETALIASETAVDAIRAEDDVIFVFLRIGNDYPIDFMVGHANYIYDTTFATLNNLLQESFLCFTTSTAPSFSPTSSPNLRTQVLSIWFGWSMDRRVS